MFGSIMLTIIPIFLITMTGIQLNAQNSNRMYRVAKIKVDKNKLVGADINVKGLYL